MGRLLLSGILQQYSGFVEANSKQTAVFLDGISALFCAVIFAKIYEKEKVRPISHVVKRRNDKRFFKDLACLLGFAVSAALFLNLFIARLGLTGLSEAYKETADIQYSVPLVLGLVNYGILQPLEEELVFRGLVYGRMRKFFPSRLSIPVSALVFGAYHGNIVQLLYAFFMGCILAWAFEKYKSLKAPFILHAVVNVVVYLLSNTESLNHLLYDGKSIVVTALLTAVFAGFFVKQSVWKMKK